MPGFRPNRPYFVHSCLLLISASGPVFPNRCRRCRLPRFLHSFVQMSERPYDVLHVSFVSAGSTSSVHRFDRHYELRSKHGRDGGLARHRQRIPRRYLEYHRDCRALRPLRVQLRVPLGCGRRHNLRRARSTQRSAGTAPHLRGSRLGRRGSCHVRFSTDYDASVPGKTFQLAPALESCDGSIPQTPHVGGMVTALADGSVRIIASTIAASVFWAAVTPAGGEALDSTW